VDLSRLRPIVVGIAAFAVASALHSLFPTPLGARYPWAHGYAAIFVAAWLEGLTGGLTATLFIAVRVQYFVLQPMHAFAVASRVDQLGELLFVVSGVLISVVAEGRHRALARAEARERERDRLLAEREALAEQAVRGREWLDTLIADVPAVVWEASGRPDEAAQRINYVSRHVERMLGYRVEEWSETPNFWLTIVDPRDRERAARESAEFFQSGRGGVSRFRWIRKDGRPIWVEAQSRVIFDGRGMPVGMRGVTVDISTDIDRQAERNELLQRTERARREAEQANRVKDDFLMTLSHELRTPLNAICGWVRMLRTSPMDEDRRRRALEVIERNSQTQLRLIEDLLDVSRIVSGKLQLRLQDVDLDALARAVCDTLRPAAEAKGIQLQADVERDAGSIAADPDRFQQVVWNLVSNAVKFTPNGGRVEVRVRRDMSWIELTVQDTGQGIDRSLLPVIFDRFRQGDTGTTRAFSGLGLGLALARSLVEAHGGTIAAESDGAGRGATFRVRLPFQPVALAAATASSSPPQTEVAGVAPSARLDRLRVLVVDDEADARELLQTLMINRGATVQTAASAAEGLQMVSAFRPDVLLCDIEMPVRDGYSLMRELRASEDTDVQFLVSVAVTGHVRAEDRTRALDAGFDAHIGKPIDAAVLASEIRSLLADRRGAAN
jgi:PAS domain S-box-containing protein